MLRTFTLLHFPNDTLIVSLPDGTLLGDAAGTAARTPGTTPAVFADGGAIFRPLPAWQEALVLQAVQARQHPEAPVAWNVLLSKVLLDAPTLLTPGVRRFTRTTNIQQVVAMTTASLLTQLATQYGWSRSQDSDPPSLSSVSAHHASALAYLNANAVVNELELLWDDQGLRLQPCATPRQRVLPSPLSAAAIQAVQWSLVLQQFKEQRYPLPLTTTLELQRLTQHFSATPQMPLNTPEWQFLRTALLAASVLVNTSDPAVLQQLTQQLTRPLPDAVTVGAAYRYVLSHLVAVA